MTLWSLATNLAAVAITLSVGMMVAWVAEHRTGNASWIDFGWTTSVGLVGAGAALAPVVPGASPLRSLVVAALIATWGARLASHLFQRALRGHDDPRYAELRRQWGVDASWRMFWFGQAQAVAGIPLVLAVLLAAHRPGGWPDWQDVAGVAIVVAGLTGAALSDRQLRSFASAPGNRGKVCDQGLWRWSRHPNYFFEWLGWVGFAVIAIDVGSGVGFGWLAVLAPALMYWLLAHVSGVPLLEEHMLRSRGEAYKAYQRTTSAFFPYPPLR